LALKASKINRYAFLIAIAISYKETSPSFFERAASGKMNYGNGKN